MVGLIVLVFLALVAGAGYLLHIRKRTEHQRQLTEKFRTSATYARIYPILKSCRQYLVEQVTIRPEELRIRMLPPDGRNLRYRFDRQQGIRLSEEQLFSLTQSVAMDLKGIGNRKEYVFQQHRDLLPDGGVERWYSFTLRPKEKDRRLRGQEEDRRRSQKTMMS